MKTRFVLINTSHAGNVGAAARAMKVMGFDDLVSVHPRRPPKIQLKFDDAPCGPKASIMEIHAARLHKVGRHDCA